MNANIIVLICLLLVLFVRHIPQLVLDLRNRNRNVLLTASLPISAYYFIAIWGVIHFVTISRLAINASEPDWETLLGLSFVIVGCILGIWALFSLVNSRAYHLEVVILENARLARSGIYAIIRHPLRLALAIEILGSVIISHLPAIITLWLALVVLQIVRSKHEDDFLRHYYGLPAIAYQREVPAANLLSGTWRLLSRKYKRLS